MTQEEKAKAYDEALERARKINSGEGVAAPSGWTTCEVIFPELKESEDEKIRKELIDIVTKSPITFAFEDKEKVLAWLEKQGEHANFRNKIQIGDKVTRNEDGVLVNMSQLNRVAKKDEKYGNVNPSEFDLRLNKLLEQFETLPKEELVSSLSFYLNVVQNDGTYKSNEKQGERNSTDKAEPKFKVGDWVFIEEIKGYKQGAFQIKSVDEFGYNFDEYHIIPFMYEELLSKWTIQDVKNGDVLVCPKYAGDIIPNIFIFKNIERKDNDVFCHCSFLEKFRTEGYVANADPINTDFYPATKEQRDILFQKMKEAGYEWDSEKKELRKIEQKQKWSEEDERERKHCVDFLNHPDMIEAAPNIANSCKDWLKFLRPQNRWKPSDEQMNILFKYAEQNNKDGSILTSLYQDLKKLKGKESD